MFTLGAAWGTVIEVGRNHVGVVGATMNSVGNLAAMLNPLIVAYSVQWFGSWNLPLYLMGVLFLVGAACWMLVDPTQPVFDELPVPLHDHAASAVGSPPRPERDARHSANGALGSRYRESPKRVSISVRTAMGHSR